jgi:hypothetical protein
MNSSAMIAGHRNFLVKVNSDAEEFLSWQRVFEMHGLAGLRATRVQQYRRARPPRGPRSRR